MIAFRQTDSRDPFLWESSVQPGGRWHGAGEGPAHCFADTPDGAWAELLRHEEITDPADVVTIRRTLWAIEIGDDEAVAVSLDTATLTGPPATWAACQSHARALRARGASRLVAPSAALRPGAARGWTVQGGLQTSKVARDGQVLVDYGSAARFVAWRCVDHGQPPVELLTRVRHVRGRRAPSRRARHGARNA